MELRNPLGFAPQHDARAGLGLVGLTERAELRGGRLEGRREGVQLRAARLDPVGGVTTCASVLVVDDDPLVRSALGLMLGGQPDVTVVGEAADGRAGVEAARELRPDVVLMDIRMPGLDGLAATVALRRGARSSARDRADDVRRRRLRAARAGRGRGRVPAQGHAAAARSSRRSARSPPATRCCLPSVTRTPDPAGRAAGQLTRPSRAQQRLGCLTEREHEVALAVGRGLSNAEIATELYLSVPTVKAHVSRLFEKLAVTNRVQIAIVVHDAGLV